jgi:signal transduction histidine kinase
MAQASSVLVLDDDPACLALATEVEPGAGVVIHTCATTAEAERLLAHVQVDAAVVDHDLGIQPSGLQWLAWLRRRDPDCYRIITTDGADLAFAVAAVNQGHIDGLLPKPWRTTQFVQLIHQGCEAALIRRHNRSLVQELGERNGQLLDLTANLERIVAERTRHLREAMDQVSTAHEELVAQQDRLVALETDGAVAQVVRGLAHELNNPLGVILGHAQRLRRAWARTEPDAVARLDVILGEVDRCVDLVDQLRGLSVPLSEAVAPCAPAGCLAQAGAALRDLGRPALDLRLPVPLPPVQAAARTLQRVFQAVLENAQDQGARRVQVSATTAPGGRVRLLVINDGATPDDAQVRNALRPFYTTRADAGGRGLGLTVAAALLREQDGSIELARREDGPGAVVAITLPGALAAPLTVGPAPRRILILDDDRLVGGLLAEAVRDLGWIPVVHTDPVAAAADVGQVDALLVDRHLGSLDGVAWAAAAVTRHPSLAGRIAVVTGDCEDPAVRGSGLPVLPKPFHLDAVERLLVDLL